MVQHYPQTRRRRGQIIGATLSARIIIILLSTLTTPAIAQSIRPIVPELKGYDSTAVRKALRSWRRDAGLRGADRPAILIATSIRQCSGCCATATNIVTGAIASYGIDADVLVVIAADARGEGLALREQFKATHVAEDIDGLLESVFDADPGAPDLYIIGPSGNVLERRRDIQRNNAIPYAEFIRAGLRPTTPGLPLVKGRSIRLAEPGRKIVDAESPVLDMQGSECSFIEPHHNAVYSFDTRTGRLARTIGDFDSLKFRFRSPDDDPRGWRLVDSLYSPMVSLAGILRGAPKGQMMIAAEFFTGYQQVDTSGPRSRMVMRRNRGIVTMEGGVRRIDLLPGAPLALGNPILLTNGTMLSVTIDEALLNGDVGRDTGSALSVFNLNNGSMVRIATLADCDSVTGSTFQPLLVGSLAESRGTIFYASEGNRAFLRIAKDGGRYRTSRIEPGGTLQQLFAAYQSDDSSVTEQVSLHDISADTTFLYVLLQDDRRSPRSDRFVVQRYTPDGTYHSEFCVRTKNDEPVSAALLGASGQELLMLAKWKKARWTIERFRTP